MQKRRRTGIVREIPAIGTVLLGKFKGVPYKARIVSDKTVLVQREME